MLSMKWFVSSPDVDAKSDIEIEGDEEKKEEVIYYLLRRLQSCTGLSLIVISLHSWYNKNCAMYCNELLPLCTDSNVQ